MTCSGVLALVGVGWASSGSGFFGGALSGPGTAGAGPASGQTNPGRGWPGLAGLAWAGMGWRLASVLGFRDAKISGTCNVHSSLNFLRTKF